MDAASRLLGSPIHGRENLAPPDRLEVALRLPVFDQEFQREYWPSSAPICLANQRVQLRCRFATIDAFTRHCCCVLKIVRHAREVQRGSSVYDDQIVDHSKIAICFAVQNCAGHSCIFSRAFTAMTNRSGLYSGVLGRNGEWFDPRARRARSDRRFVCACYFTPSIATLNDPRFLHIENLTRSCCIEEALVPRMQRGRTSSHRFAHSCEFVDCFAFSRQRDECRCYLCVGGSSIKQCIEKIRGFSARQIFSAHKSHRHLAKIEIAGFTWMIACQAVLAGWQPASRVRQSCLTSVIFA